MKGLLLLAALRFSHGALAQAAATDSFVYPQERAYGPHKAILHAPQISAWPEFGKIEGAIAIELFPDGGSKRLLATMAFSGKTSVDLAERLVRVTSNKLAGPTWSRSARSRL